ncbi:hypothetical protein [Streptomyces milbemycinicus]|uniref:hypothetical protein n=1 Tax=Streptomyces milbemycinicus TaxID=476552 RepID=UPI0033F22E47
MPSLSSGVRITESPLADLCGHSYDGGLHPIPNSSLRQLFDEGYNRMAVVLMDRETEATRVGYVDTSGKVTELSGEGSEDFADAPHEEGAVFAEDGSALWFTEDTGDTVQIVSRSVSGDHTRTEHGSGIGVNTPDDERLALAGDPAHGVYGADVLISPDGRKSLARVDDGYYIVDLPQRSVVLNDRLDGNYIGYVIECYGWVDEVRMLCGPDRDRQPDDPKRQNSFWTLDTSGLPGASEVPDSAMSKPIIPATDRKNTVRAISPNGKQMIFASLQGTRLTYYLSSTAPGSTPKKISEPGAETALSAGPVLEWR